MTAEAYADGTTFVARMAGRRIRYTTVHASRLKPYHERPAQLRPDTTAHAGKQMRITADDIVDRKLVDGNWEYRIRATSTTNAEGELHWFTEQKALERLLPSELDTFHALYDLRHDDNMPSYARRKEVHVLAGGRVLKS